MSPLKISLLLRMYAYVKPNADLPEPQAFAPAMGQALADFIAAGLVIESATLTGLRHDARDGWLTEKGVTVVESIKRAGDAAQHLRDFGPARPAAAPPAPPMPKIKPPRPDYETMLRDEFAMVALPAYVAHGGTPERAARDAYAAADAMLEARNANR